MGPLLQESDSDVQRSGWLYQLVEDSGCECHRVVEPPFKFIFPLRTHKYCLYHEPRQRCCPGDVMGFSGRAYTVKPME